MEISWSKEQQEIIRFSGGNLLVSAAAGSGKTAVLIAHIMRRLLDTEKPADVDRFLLVTFTKAAAQEMKDRLYKAIFQELEHSSENNHLRKQLKLIQHAEISTIDSFCSRVVQGHFAEIGLDPAFRIGDQSELSLLREDVLKDLLEEEYAKGTQEFLDLSETLSPGKEDNQLSNTILDIHRALESQVNPDLFLQKCRENYGAETTEELQKMPFYQFYRESTNTGNGLTDEEILKELKKDQGRVLELFRLVGAFSERLLEAKKKGRVFDFSDISHFALQILQKDGEPTETAKKMAEYYEEILIDEYQDSNDLQEAILTAIAKPGPGKSNMVMVGDMKQSIYRFRNARPELFVQKYNTYLNQEGASERKIELGTNYRSKPAVIHAVNEIFTQLMHKEIGNIEYDENAKLYVSEENKDDFSSGDDRTTEMIFLRGEDAEDSRKKEVTFLAGRILQLVDPDNGFDVHTKEGTRKARFSDIVILLRSTKGWEQTFVDLFGRVNIPFSMGANQGFFETFEIRLLTDLLSVIDNALNDIPLVSVLHSFLFNFTDEDLAKLEIFRKEENQQRESIFQNLKHYHGEKELEEKVRFFLGKLLHYRKKSYLLDLESLLRYIYQDLHLLERVAAMPEGIRREANLEALLHRAAEFEKTNYQGIFQFLRYIEQKKLEAEKEDSEIAFEDDNVVKIMTIHKSKGLEFPIVFVSGTGKEFNQEYSKKNILMDADLGIALKNFDIQNRLKKKPAIYLGIQQKVKTDNLGEELRVLYVALTRAKEKLIITGSQKFSEKDWQVIKAGNPGGRDSCQEMVQSANCMAKWLGGIHASLSYVMTRIPEEEEEMPGNADFVLNLPEKEEKKKAGDLFKELEEGKLSADPGIYRDIREQLGFDYHYDDLYKILQTLSVSYLKALFVSDCEAFAKEYAKESSLIEDLSLEERKTVNGARLGTLYHTVMEQLQEEETAEDLLTRLLQEGLILQEEKDKINPYKIDSFRKSDLAKRFFEAEKKGFGFREKQFIIGVPVKEIYPSIRLKDEREQVMIQGIMDMYFEEPDGLVLVDYKTDRIKEEKEFVNRYKTQLDFYERALKQITGKTVKEKWIYAFYLEKGIRL